MGNRAVITWSYDLQNELGIYLHWNGGPVSVKAFLRYCELKGYRSPDEDCYGYARFCQVVGNFFGGGLSIGIDLCKRLDCHNSDNGVYVCQGWKVDGQLWHNGVTEEHDFQELLEAIDAAQPKKEQLGCDFLRSKEVPTSELKIGDTVFIYDHIYGKYKKCTVLEIGKNGARCSGMDVGGIPYCDFLGTESPEMNINNYIESETCRVLVME